jgi:hypothetical protein
VLCKEEGLTVRVFRSTYVGGEMDATACDRETSVG